MAPPAPRSADEIAALLARFGCGDAPRLVGIELEMGLVRQDDLQPARYEGPGGIEELLERLLRLEGQEPLREDGRLIGLKGPAGNTITLEPGGQFELSTTPCPDLGTLVAIQRERTALLAREAAACGLYLLGGGMVPAPQEAMPWMPKERYRIMRAYFQALGEPGRLAHTMMQRSLSVQVSLDYRDAGDAAELTRLAFLLAPVATALFACSPLDGGRETGFRSWRAEVWRHTDPARAGEIAAAAGPGGTLRDYVEFMLDVPMMFRVRDEQYEAMHGASFRRLLEQGGWDDGAPLGLDDLWTHMSGVFTDARVKKGLVELRSTDGVLPAEVGAVPAFWVGLLYDPAARDAVHALLDPLTADERARARADVPRLGLEARLGARPMLDVARELLAVARGGLERRIARGDEVPAVLELLAPLERRLAAGTTAADEVLEAWRGPWERDLRRLVAAHAFPPG